MPDIAFIRPNYPGEKRVALLPNDVAALRQADITPKFESGFGTTLGIGDAAYEDAGASIVSRSQAFEGKIVFSLKLIQAVDYPLLKSGQTIVGWMHPTGSGTDFYQYVAKKKQIKLLDLDSVYPRLYAADVRDLEINPPHFFWENSMIAGIASVQLAEKHFGLSPTAHKSVAVLGSGSVSQGVFLQLARSGFMPRMFYRKTLPLFFASIADFDVIFNGIEMDAPGHILDRLRIQSTKPGCLLVDAAADAGRSLEGTTYHPLDCPVSSVFGRPYILVNNAPTLLFKEASARISSILANGVLKQALDQLLSI